MASIRIGFSTSPTIVSRVIRFFTRGRSSHTFFLVDVDGHEVVVGADWNGMVAQSYRRFLGRGNEVLALYDSEDLDFDLSLAEEFLLDHLDERYNYLGLVGMIFPSVWAWFGRARLNPWRYSRHRRFCSEFVVEALQRVGFPGAERFLAHSTEPNAVWRFLEERRRSLRR